MEKKQNYVTGYVDIAKDVETRFYTSNYESEKPFPKGKVIALIKDGFGGNIMTEFAALKPKIYSYFTDDYHENRNAKATKKGVKMRKHKYEYYKNSLEANQYEKEINYLEKIKLTIDSFRENHKEFIKINRLILKLQQRFRSEEHNVFTEEVNKISLGTNDDKSIQPKEYQTIR